MTPELLRLQGILCRGYGVAGGASQDYPYGSLERQIPIFKSRGLDLEPLYRGTLNIDIRPFVFELRNPQFTFRAVAWTDLHPPEDFSFAGCRVAFAGVDYDGWIYYPHPETKRRNFQDSSLLEVIAPRIPNLVVGCALEVFVDPARVSIAGREAGEQRP